MRALFLAGLIAGAAATSAHGQAAIEAATLPDARSVAIGDPATYFGVIANNGDATATNCRIEKFASDTSPTTFSYQTVAPDNTLTGTQNTPVDIAAGTVQNFLITLTPSASFENEIGLSFICDNATALGRPGVNDVFLVASTGTPADLITIMITPSADGVIRVANAGGIELAAGAVTNIQGGNVNVVARPYFLALDSTLGHTLTICETNPSTGDCLAPAAATVDMTIGSDTQTFSVFVDADDIVGISLDPSFMRVAVDFDQRRTFSTGPVRGRSSVAVTAPSAAAGTPDLPGAGTYTVRLHDLVNDPTGEDLLYVDFAIDEEGNGVGTFLRTDFLPPALQALRLEGNFAPNSTGGGVYGATVTFLEDARFGDLGTSTGQLTFSYDALSGFFGEYSATPSTPNLASPAISSLTSEQMRANGGVDRLGLECAGLFLGDYDVYFGDEPFEGRTRDGTANFDVQGFDPPIRGRLTGGTEGGDSFSTLIRESTINELAVTFGFEEPLRLTSTAVTVGGEEMINPVGTLLKCTENGFTVIFTDESDNALIVHFVRSTG